MASASAAPAAPKKSETRAALDALVAGCEVDVKRGVIRKCKHHEKRELVVAYARGDKDRLAALPDFADALSNPDQKLQTVAANVLHSAFRASLGDTNIGSIPADVARDLLAAIPKLGRRQAARALPTVVHAMVLAGLNDELYKFLDDPKNQPLAAVGYRYLLTHGGMAVFEKLQKVIASEPVGNAVGALEGLRTYKAPSEEAHKQICDAAQKALADERRAVSTKAASALVRCQGDYVDAAIAFGNKNLKDKTFDVPLSRAFANACTPAGMGRPGAPSEKQCASLRKLLEAALTSKAVDGTVQVGLVGDVARQWPDAKTKTLLRRLEKGKDERLAARAKDALARMEGSTGGVRLPAGKPHATPKGAAPGKPATP